MGLSTKSLHPNSKAWAGLPGESCIVIGAGMDGRWCLEASLKERAPKAILKVFGCLNL